MNKIKSLDIVLYSPATVELINIIKPLVYWTLKVESRAFPINLIKIASLMVGSTSC